jgi:hypothetical protein
VNFVARPKHSSDAARDLARERKLRHWAAEYAQTGPAGSLRVAGALREHARLVNGDWPTPADRQRDFDEHLRMRSVYDRIAHGLVQLARRQSSR